MAPLSVRGLSRYQVFVRPLRTADLSPPIGLKQSNLSLGREQSIAIDL